MANRGQHATQADKPDRCRDVWPFGENLTISCMSYDMWPTFATKHPGGNLNKRHKQDGVVKSDTSPWGCTMLPHMNSFVTTVEK